MLNPLVVASTFAALHSRLKHINVVVPGRANGRTKEHVELYSVIRLLGSLPRAAIDFPVRVTKRERPDFLVEFGVRKIGVEHTEAISQPAAKEAFLRSQGHGRDVKWIHVRSIDEPVKRSKKMIAEIQEDRLGTVWEGDSVEREWANAMAHVISEKVASASRTGFDKFEENWLLIYDNWTVPALDRENGMMLLRSRLNETNPWQIFSRVFILDEKMLLEISSAAPCSHQVNHCLP